MKPIYSFLFFLCSLALLLVFSYFSPIKTFSLFNTYTIKIPDFFSYLNTTQPKYSNIENILIIEQSIRNVNDSALIELTDTNTTTVIAEIEIIDSTQIDIPDTNTIIQPKTITPKQETPITYKNINEVKRIEQPIDYPAGNKSVLYPFFKALSTINNNHEIVRILHYGDSQIEGDRISSYLRNELQKRFGGTGNGLFPVREMRDNNVSIQLTLSKNWKEYGLRGNANVPAGHKQFGTLMHFSRYNRFNDYLDANKDNYEAWIHLKRQSFSYPLSRYFKQFRIFYGFNKKPFIVQMTKDGEPLDADIIPPCNELNVLHWEFEQTPMEFTIKFQGEDSPDIFAIALDDKKGIALDNISLRGSSGLEFTKTNPVFFNDMYKQLNVKLVLLQFGVNIVPNIVSDYSYYENNLYQQLAYLKKLQPDLSIIILGVSDISRKKGSHYESYPNIEKIRAAQKRAALRANCAFWDIYSAMGGNNSMPAWVFANPPLAQKDFIHFSYQGSKVIGEMFLQALLNDYNEYLSNEPNP
jgi:hypothetical protein